MKLFSIFTKIKKKNYIEWDQTNNMWHDGTIRVYKDDKLVESIHCLNGGWDEEGNKDDSFTNPYDLIEELKAKWNLEKVKEIKGPDWR